MKVRTRLTPFVDSDFAEDRHDLNLFLIKFKLQIPKKKHERLHETGI